MPNVTERNPAYNQYINGKGGIIRRWIAAGASGWRLDVADELPDEFLAHLRTAAKIENPEALVLGEVWEDASNKSDYGKRRKCLLGDELDSVMNYPFRSAILGFLRGEDPGKRIERRGKGREKEGKEGRRVGRKQNGRGEKEQSKGESEKESLAWEGGKKKKKRRRTHT